MIGNWLAGFGSRVEISDNQYRAASNIYIKPKAKVSNYQLKNPDNQFIPGARSIFYIPCEVGLRKYPTTNYVLKDDYRGNT